MNQQSGFGQLVDGFIIAIIGNSGVGKTTFAQQLHLATGYSLALEQHQERPYQHKFYNDRRKFGLQNQIDYLLYRTEQEISIRQNKQTGILDGGVDLDFHVFTKLFWQLGYLSDDEFQLCERLYLTVRELLPPPELFIWLHCPIEIVTQRYHLRSREEEITGCSDAHLIENLLSDWMKNTNTRKILKVDASCPDLEYTIQIQQTIQYLQARIKG